jgi:catechol 2,3-dioxygenase-like lactoylglutathione lyase family enzyme
VAFISTRDAARARRFYADVLGLRVVSEDAFAMVVDCGGTTLRITRVTALAPAPFTVLGWSVADIRRTVDGLREKGVAFERYDGLDQDEAGIWSAPGGSLVAWFKDPDENVLSVTGPGRPTGE